MMPKRVKFRKSQRGKIKGNATRGNTVAFGEFGLQALKPAWISDVAITRMSRVHARWNGTHTKPSPAKTASTAAIRYHSGISGSELNTPAAG